MNELDKWVKNLPGLTAELKADNDAAVKKDFWTALADLCWGENDEGGILTGEDDGNHD